MDSNTDFQAAVPSPSDVYQDFIAYRNNPRDRDRSKLRWQLVHTASPAEYKSWESVMERGFTQCRTLDDQFGDKQELLLAQRRVDAKVCRLW